MDGGECNQGGVVLESGIGAEPCPGGADVAKDAHKRDGGVISALYPAEANGDGRATEDQQCSVFFRVPCPIAAQIVFCPKHAQDNANGGKSE